MKKSYLGTFTGKLIDVLDPNPEDICIEDIAHALSMLCRYGGHSNQFYSVAEHSVHISNLTEEFPLCGLMHDASEAYLVDVPRPVKYALGGYKEIEENLMQVIANKFNFSWPMPQIIKYYDDTIISDELIHLLPDLPKATFDNRKFLNQKIYCWDPETAKNKFLERWKELT